MNGVYIIVSVLQIANCTTFAFYFFLDFMSSTFFSWHLYFKTFDSHLFGKLL